MRCGSSEELKVLKWVAKQAKAIVQAKRVYLFGSRARGDAHERSDFDIALETDMPQKLAEFQEALEENPLTLLAFDVVDLAHISEEFRDRIMAEAKEIILD